MWQNLPLFPEQASTIAPRVDALFFFLVAVSIFFGSLIFFLLIFFAVKYRRRSEQEQPRPITGNLPLEILWTAVPLGLTMIMFVWGAMLFFEINLPPGDALEIHVVGKQWMWKIQHPEGRREINQLHVPVGRPVKLTMTSEDVIHDFFVPAFRVKKDVLPGGYATVWFQATKAGEYHLFCSQYCGTQHSGMMGKVVVMEPAEYEKWLSLHAAGVSTAAAGEMLFHQLGCGTCHRPDSAGKGPSLEGLFGKPVRLRGSRTASADEGYIRESILDPQAKVVAGYPPVMPTFKGLITEDGILQIIAYIKSLQREERTQP